MNLDPNLEELMGRLGEFGRYQLFQHVLHVLSGFAAGLHMLTLVTVAPTPPHRCFIEGVDNSDNVGPVPWDSPGVLAAIPNHQNNILDSCHVLDKATNESVLCNRFVYDTSTYTYSRVMEWDMVCEYRWMRALVQSLYMFGVLAGAVLLGALGDRFGRKKIFCWSGLLQVIFGVGAALCPEFVSYCIVRFIYGFFGSSGAYVTGFVLSMELVGASKRTRCGVTFQAAFAVGVMVVAAWGAIIPDRLTLQVIYGLHGLLLLPHWWLLDESVRWLWCQGRVSEAVCIVQKGLRMNGSTVVLDVEDYENRARALEKQRKKEAEERGIDVENEQTPGISDLFRTPNLRKKTLNVCLNWMANSLAYYGLSLNTDKLEGNPYLVLFLMCLAEIPSYVMTVLLLDRLGRRSMTAALMIIGGIALILIAFVPESESLGNVIIGLALVGKFMIAGSFAIIYNYTAEMFPTVLRNSAIGLGAMNARFAGALTPFISLLDSVSSTLPSIIFGTLVLLSGSLTLLLPETLNKNLPQTLEDGENFGVGDTCCASFCGRRSDNNNRRRSSSNVPAPSSIMIPSNHTLSINASQPNQQEEALLRKTGGYS